MEPTVAPIAEWLLQAVRDAAARPRERLLVLGDLPLAALLSLAHAVGNHGQVIASGRKTTPVQGLHPALHGVESPAQAVPTSRFDIVFAALEVPSAQPAAELLAQARNALRPGGRMLLDLPAQAWSDDCARVQPILATAGLSNPTGPDAADLERALLELGLRQGKVIPLTCLHPLTDAEELVDLILAAQPSPSRVDIESLRLAVVELLARRPGPRQTVLRRQQVSARR